ncbi:hypothetical protein CDD83_7862 [Cordyceps sp. RAO-2017]|nr:hypothetical protein CDD83_7862 [Cordyceps sp. RAO-2017]
MKSASIIALCCGLASAASVKKPIESPESWAKRQCEELQNPAGCTVERVIECHGEILSRGIETAVKEKKNVIEELKAKETTEWVTANNLSKCLAGEEFMSGPAFKAPAEK